MSLTIVHNISDRAPSVEAHAIVIGGVEIRPGKSQLVSTSKINKKHKKLHGSVLWFGNLPSRIANKEPKKILRSALNNEQVKEFLKGLDREALEELGLNVTPQVTSTTKSGYVYALLAAIFSEEHDLNPEMFFWTRKWAKMANGDYLEL